MERAVRTLLQARGFQSKRIRTSVGEVHTISKRNRPGDRTLAMLHGLGASSAQLAPMLLRLSEHFDHLIAYDMPAHGFSEVPSPLDESAMETGIREMLERTLTRPAVLFGNSMGGFAAIRFAIERPDLVERLVLCAPGGAQMTEAELDQLRDVFRIQTHGEAVEFLDRLFARPAKLRHIYAFGVRRKLSDEGLQQLLGNLSADRLLTKEQLKKLDRPALVLWGRQDGILPKSGLAFFEEHLPGATIEEVDGFGHSPQIEAPERVVQRILNYCEQA